LCVESSAVVFGDVEVVAVLNDVAEFIHAPHIAHHMQSDFTGFVEGDARGIAAVSEVLFFPEQHAVHLTPHGGVSHDESPVFSLAGVDSELFERSAFFAFEKDGGTAIENGIVRLNVVVGCASRKRDVHAEFAILNSPVFFAVSFHIHAGEQGGSEVRAERALPRFPVVVAADDFVAVVDHANALKRRERCARRSGFGVPDSIG